MGGLATLSPLRRVVLTTMVFVLGASIVLAQTPVVHPTPVPSRRLQRIVNEAVQETVTQFAGIQLKTNQVALTLVDLHDLHHPEQAAYRGGVQIYPASVVKLFYLVAVHRWLEDGRLKDTEELRRAMHDMIVDSINEATHYVVDVLTDTTSGPELAPAELEAWQKKRNAVNRYFSALGYSGINVNKKPWCEGPYGREMQASKAFTPARNFLTTDATARLLTAIVTGAAVSPKRCREMMSLLARDPFAPTDDPENQAKFTGPALPQGAKLWSKAGWTSEVRHDATYIELPTGERFVLVMFTADHANEREILPALARAVILKMRVRS